MGKSDRCLVEIWEITDCNIRFKSVDLYSLYEGAEKIVNSHLLQLLQQRTALGIFLLQFLNQFFGLLYRTHLFHPSYETRGFLVMIPACAVVEEIQDAFLI